MQLQKDWREKILCCNPPGYRRVKSRTQLTSRPSDHTTTVHEQKFVFRELERLLQFVIRNRMDESSGNLCNWGLAVGREGLGCLLTDFDLS